MSAELLDRINSKLEARRATLRAEAAAQYADLVARFTASSTDEVDVAAEEVEAILEARGKTLADLRADIDRVVQRRAAVAVWTQAPAARQELAAAEQSLADLDAAKKAFLEQHAQKVRDAKDRIATATAEMRRINEARGVLQQTAPAERMAPFIRQLDELHAEEVRLGHELPLLRNRIIDARHTFEAQVAGRSTDQTVNVVEIFGSAPQLYGQSAIDARVNGELYRVRTSALEDARKQGVTESARDAYAHTVVERAREELTERYTREARAPLTALESQLAAGELAFAEIPKKRSAVREQMERAFSEP
ncbi:MAG TPA: hypothetical protein VGE74_32865 [Gemmata sp.]